MNINHYHSIIISLENKMVKKTLKMNFIKMLNIKKNNIYKIEMINKDHLKFLKFYCL